MNEDKKELMLLELEVIKGDLLEIRDGEKPEFRIEDALRLVDALTDHIKEIKVNDKKEIELFPFFKRA